jgi:hypothetical protein
MTDRELLELAAKACGIEEAKMRIEFNQWNPLTDDGDALRLAVRLRLVISPTDVTVMAYEPSTMSRGEVYAPIGSDPFAATRRAITRAAAEIGRTTP